MECLCSACSDEHSVRVRTRLQELWVGHRWSMRTSCLGMNASNMTTIQFHRLTALLYCYMRVCKCQLFTDEGSRRLPKCLNYCVTVLASATNQSIWVYLATQVYIVIYNSIVIWKLVVFNPYEDGVWWSHLLVCKKCLCSFLLGVAIDNCGVVLDSTGVEPATTFTKYGRSRTLFRLLNSFSDKGLPVATSL